MIKPLPTANEAERLDFLLSLNVLDTLPEDEFDAITKLASSCLKMPVSLISFVEKDRQWFKAKTGTDICETSRDVSFCAHAIHNDNVMVVENADEDPRFVDNPLVTNTENPIKFYAGVPIILDKQYALGTLCLIDTKPRQLSDGDIDMIKQFGKHVEKLIELRMANQKIKLQKELLSEQHEKLKEFAGVISHDMKMPLANIIVTSDILKAKYSENLDDQALVYLAYLKDNSLSLSDYINNILEYYQSDKIDANDRQEFDVNEMLESIVEILNIEDKCDIEFPHDNHIINSNRAALAQVFLNLITNALKYNDKEFIEIKITSKVKKDSVEFSIWDNGMGIPKEKQTQIFDLYETLGSADRKGNKGHGIGLSMVKKICEKLGGGITVCSEPGEGTKFTFHIAA